jgi:uracil-DNA glycosylase
MYASTPAVISPNIEESWKKALWDTFQTDSFVKLKAFLRQEKEHFIIYPPSAEIFNAFNLTPLDKVKVVILGQDPYHGPNQAHGLCFSVRKGIKPPPSLVNIFKELHQDVGIPIPEHGELTSWARQGVFLLNAILTVRQSEAGSHQGKGWEMFTDQVIRSLNEKRENLVFMLWGKYAIAKSALIDPNRHLVLTAPHPSPFSAHTGFLGCRHFSAANRYLTEHDLTPINWALNPD